MVKEAFPLVQTLYAATALTRNYIHFDPSCEEARSLFGLSQSELDDIAEEAREEVDNVASSMGVAVRRGSLLREPDQGEDGEDDKDLATKTVAEAGISSRVKNISLQTGFLEELLQAADIREMLAAFERSLNILLHIDASICFLPDEKGVLLVGATSEQNSLMETSRGLSLPLLGSTSKVVRAYKDRMGDGVISVRELGDNLADRQLLSLLQTEIAIAVPLFVKTSTVGVAVLGLPEVLHPLTEHNRRLMASLAQQLALCVHLEKEKAERAQALHQERMEAISTTARKFAHEINNPLGIINNYLTGIKLKLSTDQQELGQDFDVISEEIQRISSMVDQMRLFSQAPFAKMEQIDLNGLINDLVNLLKTSFFAQEDLAISFVPGSEIPTIVSSKDAIKQVLINLLKNAAEAMPEGGRVSVRTRKRVEPTTAANSGVEIIVADTGPGLPEVVQNNLYQPFTTTKQSSNSGLGLSIVYKAILDIGGEISCTTSTSDGTTFLIALPLDTGKTVS
jgi:signal transduction histidine kinase